MLIVDFSATRARLEERCINLNKVARKYGIKERSLHMFVQGRFFGQSGCGVCGQMEQALIAMDLLVFEAAGEERQEAETPAKAA
ncbi:MAG: hypothetical protein HXX11_18050 [Desulfuromonadales bacterium]|nr:hypothetical protein [Desulfuromonadales bacterium]